MRSGPTVGLGAPSAAGRPSLHHAEEGSFAAEIAAAAGGRLLAHRTAHESLAGKALGEAGDRLAHEFLMARIGERFPDDAVLSEEAVDDETRLAAHRVWIIDPLDGTREYGEGREDWAVHVALWERGSLTAGAVALPGIGVTLASDRPPVLPPRRDAGPLRIAVSRTRPPEVVHRLADRMAVQLVPMGSAGWKAAAVLRGDVDAYLHAGGQYEWDSAAPVVVARAAGAVTTRLDGSELVYNARNPLLPDLLVARADVAEALRTALDPLLRGDAA